MTHAIQRLAKQCLNHFELKTRDNGDKFWCLKNKDNGALENLVRTAHGEMLPNDYRYEYIVDSLSALVDADIDEDTALDEIDYYDILNEIEADHSNYELCKWLGSHAHRIADCDEAVEEAGHNPSSIIEYIQMGQIREKTEVYGSVYQSLRAYFETLDEEGR